MINLRIKILKVFLIAADNPIYKVGDLRFCRSRKWQEEQKEIREML